MMTEKFQLICFSRTLNTIIDYLSKKEKTILAQDIITVMRKS